MLPDENKNTPTSQNLQTTGWFKTLINGLEMDQLRQDFNVSRCDSVIIFV